MCNSRILRREPQRTVQRKELLRGEGVYWETELGLDDDLQQGL